MSKKTKDNDIRSFFKAGVTNIEKKPETSPVKYKADIPDQIASKKRNVKEKYI